MTSTMRFDRWEKPDASQAVTFDQLAGGTGLVPIAPTSLTVAGGTASVNTFGQITFTAITSLSLNGVFSSSYKNYKFLINQTASTGSGLQSMQFRWRKAGTDLTAASYFQGGHKFGSNGTLQNYNGSSLDRLYIYEFVSSATNYINASVEVMNPASATFPVLLSQAVGNNSTIGPALMSLGSVYVVADTVDGFTLFPTVSSTGTIQVFAYND